jgi:hypothetical protein
MDSEEVLGMCNDFRVHCDTDASEIGVRARESESFARLPDSLKARIELREE